MFLPRREREKAKDRNGNGFGLTLGMAVKLWPTPNASPVTFGGVQCSGDGREIPNKLGWAVGGSLNPTWVEWLMGFPPGWTDLDASATP